jgi:hypothetical protein
VGTKLGDTIDDTVCRVKFELRNEIGRVKRTRKLRFVRYCTSFLLGMFSFLREKWKTRHKQMIYHGNESGNCSVFFVRIQNPVFTRTFLGST